MGWKWKFLEIKDYFLMVYSPGLGD
jgi:hypothetical protein